MPAKAGIHEHGPFQTLLDGCSWTPAFERVKDLPAVDRPKAEIAQLLGVSHQHLYDILDERKPVTPAMAARLGKLFGNGPELWLDLQSAYDLAAVTKKLAAELKKIPTLTAA